MSDERLRELERRVKESPGDFVAGHELARALERAGEARRARSEVARLARAGDLEARRELGRRAPARPSLLRQGARRALRVDVPWRVSRRSLNVGDWSLAGADDERIYVETAHGLRAIDARTLAEVWRHRAGSRGFVLEGFFVLWWDRRLLVLDPRDGTTIASRMPDTKLLMAAGDADRLAVVEMRYGSMSLLVLDAPTLQVIRSIPSADRPMHLELCAGRVVVGGEHIFQRGGTLQVLDAESGDNVWVRSFQGTAPSFHGVDPSGLLVRWNDRYIEFDLASGRDNRFEAGIEMGDETQLAEGRVLIARAGQLEAVARDTGRSAWQVPLVARSNGEAYVTDEHVWSLRTTSDPRSTEMELVVFEVATGLDVKRLRLPTGSTDQVRPRMVVLDGALVILGGSADLAIVRVEEDERRR